MKYDPSIPLEFYERLMDSIQSLNAECFNGQLSAAVLAHLAELPKLDPEARAFVARICRFMKLSGITAEDFSPQAARALCVLPPKVLPHAWDGAIPMMTGPGRHQLVDEYLRQSPWIAGGPGTQMLDIGCGFPPVTTIDTARQFDEWTVKGAASP